MYILFISKEKNSYRAMLDRFGNPFDKVQRNLTDLYVQQFLRRTGKRNLIVFPGYLSSKYGTASDFSERYIDMRYKYDIWLFDGMGSSTRTFINAGCMVGHGGSGSKVHFNTILKRNKDHRKMVFICDEPLNVPSDFSCENDVRSFANSCKVLAVLVGSSNLSYDTYYNNNKGEADVFLFNDNNFAGYIQESINQVDNNVTPVLSKSVTKVSANYFNDILYDTIIAMGKIPIKTGWIDK